jgi:serine/threonine protein kinase
MVHGWSCEPSSISKIDVEKIGPFKVIAGPFEGGFGVVYKVFDTDSADEFALKTPKVFVTTTAPQLELFRREITHWTNLPVHPNVVRAIRAFEHESRPYVLMEWVGGGTLQQRMSELKPADEELAKLTGAVDAIEVLRQISDGMAHVHACGLIHSDLKPQNILMWGRSPQITDFGFSRVAGANSESIIGGTPRYMAPEMETSEPTVSSDIYAAGIIFEEVLAQFTDNDFGVAAVRELAKEMTDLEVSRRPASFTEVRDRLASVLAKSEIAPAIAPRSGDRCTWDEKHAHALPQRFRFEEVTSDIAAGSPSDAKTKLLEIIAQQPDMVDARIQIALMLADDECAAEAVEHLQAAEAAQPDRGRLLNIAAVYARLGKWEDAERLLVVVEPERADDPRIWMMRSEIADKRGDLTSAIDHCRRYLECGGGAHARYSLGRLLKDAGLIEEAIENLSGIGEEDAGVAISARQLLARICVDTGRYNDAIREYRQLLQLGLGNDTQAYYYAEIGYCYKAQELFDAAVASYEKCLLLKPDDQRALEGLREAQAKLNSH